MRKFWISLSYATFQINEDKGVVVFAAPVANWMVGRALEQIRPWLLKKKSGC